MQFTTSVTQKGQATIPALIRKRLGINHNTKIVFELKDNNEASIKPVVDFISLKGSIKTNRPFDVKAWEKAIEDEIMNKFLPKAINKYVEKPS